jgi:hypothetical protein
LGGSWSVAPYSVTAKIRPGPSSRALELWYEIHAMSTPVDGQGNPLHGGPQDYGSPPQNGRLHGYGDEPAGAPVPGYAIPAPLQGYGAPPPSHRPQAQPPTGPPSWVRIVARVFLALGILLAVGTVVGASMSEQLGVNLAMATPGPLGFGIVATLLSRKSSTGGAAKPLGIGCLVGFVLSAALAIFFTVLWQGL